MGNTRNGQAAMIAPLNPVPALVQLAEQLGRHAEIDPKIQEAGELLKARLNEIDGSDRAEFIVPLLWSWVRNIPICPPWAPGGPHHPPSLAAIAGGGVYTYIGDGSRMLPATEAFLEAFLDSQSLEAATNEVARWSRSATRNADRLAGMQEEFREFQDECGKLGERRKFGFDDAIAIGLIAVAGAVVGGMIGGFAQ